MYADAFEEWLPMAYDGNGAPRGRWSSEWQVGVYIEATVSDGGATKNPKLFQCPSDQRVPQSGTGWFTYAVPDAGWHLMSYAPNHILMGHASWGSRRQKYTRVLYPGEACLMADAEGPNGVCTGNHPSGIALRHGWGASIGFADGHVSLMMLGDIPNRDPYPYTGTKFWAGGITRWW